MNLGTYVFAQVMDMFRVMNLTGVSPGTMVSDTQKHFPAVSNSSR